MLPTWVSPKDSGFRRFTNPFALIPSKASPNVIALKIEGRGFNVILTLNEVKWEESQYLDALLFSFFMVNIVMFMTDSCETCPPGPCQGQGLTRSGRGQGGLGTHT